MIEMVEAKEVAEQQEAVSAQMRMEQLGSRMQELTADYNEAKEAGFTDLAESYQAQLEELQQELEELKAEPYHQGEALQTEDSEPLSFGNGYRSNASKWESAKNEFHRWSKLADLRGRALEQDPTSSKARIDYKSAIRQMEIAQKDMEYYSKLIK